MSPVLEDHGEMNSMTTATYATSTSSYLHSIRPSRRAREHILSDELSPAARIRTFNSLSSQSTALEAIVTTLRRTGLPGPILLIGIPSFIGDGAQFAVYKQKAVKSTNGPGFRSRLVAVKQPKFNLNPDEYVRLSDSSMRKHLHDMYLEIIALTTPKLAHHPNISRLFGWGFDQNAFHTLPSLIMDLAMETFEALLSDRTKVTTIASRAALCYDVALGLDAVHECEIMHGDLKPANVLIYMEQNRLVAKLADFGLCTVEVNERAGVRLGGTPGWMAPEVEAQALLRGGDLIQAENFSYGLLLWRVTLHRGQVRQPGQLENIVEDVIADFERWSLVEEWQYLQNLQRATAHLLAPLSEGRPWKVASTISDIELSDIASSAIATDTDSEDNESTYSDIEPIPYPSDAYFEHELSPINPLFIFDLYDDFLKDPESFSPETLVILFLHLTLYEDKDANELVNESVGNKALNVLSVAALKGSAAAQSMMPAAYRYFQESPHHEIEKRMKEWLVYATENGSTLAYHELENRGDRNAADQSLESFRIRGGYNQYFGMGYAEDQASNSRQDLERGFEGQTTRDSLVQLVMFGSIDAIETCLQELSQASTPFTNPAVGKFDILVYLACVRGSWNLVMQLLAIGCGVHWREPLFNLGCLHWVFAMPQEHQNDAFRTLLANGADFETLALEEVPMPFPPFVLPAGTALHWAVVLSCDETINMLLDYGANPLTRDGSDPYLFDEVVRPFDKFGGIDFEGFSVPKEKTAGLTPLDYAAIRYSPHIFRALRFRELRININDQDEEGFTVLHRLSTSTAHRTRLGIEYSIEPTLPSVEGRSKMMGETLDAILAIGGDLEALTRAREYDDLWTTEQFTPLMLAVERGESDLVEYLLRAGACVHTQNAARKTALHCYSRDEKQHLRCLKILCDYGADFLAPDQQGDTPVVKAALSKMYEAVDYLLSLGADIDSRSGGGETVTEFGEKVPRFDSIFSLLASQRVNGTSGPDRSVADLLVKHVVNHPDKPKRDRVLALADLTGTALLYRFAENRMLECVKLLLQQGVDPNVKTRKWEIETEVRKARVWYETPLDGLLLDRRQLEIDMERDGLYSAQVYEQHYQKSRDVEVLLRSSGGFTLLSDNGHA